MFRNISVRSHAPRTRPHVLHVVLSLHPGGTERLVIDLIDRLRPDADASVCCLDEAGDWASDVIARGVDVVSVHRRPGFHPSLARRVAAVAVRQRATVLHCHHYSPYVYGRLAALGRRPLPVVFTEHGRLFDHRPSRKRRLANAVFTRFSGTFCAVSEDLKRHMVAEGFPAERVQIIHNGIEPGPLPGVSARQTAREALGITSDRYVVGTVARLDPVKNVPMLLEAFARLRTTMATAELVIVGDGHQREALMKTAQAAGISSAVRFAGARSDARTLLPAFDVYVNSSVTEGVSVTILEAMAAGVPVVATRVGGTPEVVLHQTTGVLVPSRDPQALAAALTELAASPARAAQLAAGGRRRIAAHFTMSRMAEQYLRLYDASQRAS